jgi:hypothetical protein
MSLEKTFSRRSFLGTAAAVTLAGNAPARPDAGRLEFKDFLPQLTEKDPERQDWWLRFQKAESFARECVGRWQFAALTAVALTESKPARTPDGVTKLTKETLKEGGLYREVFHSALANSPFQLKAQSHSPDYRLYGECLCNAFQYFMEVTLGPRGYWMKKVSEWRPKTWAQIIARSTDLAYDLTYGLPALEFIKSCNGFPQFKAMFAELNAKSTR